MSLRLTPHAIIAAYDYLKTTAPFNKWKLPEADDLEFHVTDHADRYGHTHLFHPSSGHYSAIGISNKRTKTSYHLIEVLAHEMCHLKQFQDCKGARKITHGPTFKRLAEQVCRIHGFSLKTF